MEGKKSFLPSDVGHCCQYVAGREENFSMKIPPILTGYVTGSGAETSRYDAASVSFHRIPRDQCFTESIFPMSETVADLVLRGEEKTSNQ